LIINVVGEAAILASYSEHEESPAFQCRHIVLYFPYLAIENKELFPRTISPEKIRFKEEISSSKLYIT
jgi:hypothetical protein